MSLVLFMPVLVVFVALVLGIPALMLFGRLLETLHVATIASWLGIATFLVAAA